MIKSVNKRKYATVSAVVLCLCLAVLVEKAEGAKKENNPQGSKGWYIKTLNRWGAQSEGVKKYSQYAMDYLDSKKDATYADLAADKEFQRIALENGITHIGGPMLGCITKEGVKVWIRTLKPAKVEVGINIGGTEKIFGPVESTLKSDLVAIVKVEGLNPETSYPYRLLIDGKQVKIPGSALIVTAPDDSKPSKVRITFGTCPHVWGLGNKKQAETILKHQPSAMLLYGDIAAQDNGLHRGLARCGYLVRDTFEAWKNLAARVPVFTSWDDHDYFDNDFMGVTPPYTEEDQKLTREVFVNSWNNPPTGIPGTDKGIFTRSRIGSCDVLMTDNKYFVDDKKKEFLGQEQMKWLETQLLDCKGPFIVISCGTMWSDYVTNGKNSWGAQDKAGRERLFSFIEKNNIAGVLLISGDRHGARGFTIPRPSGFTFYEFEPASLGGRNGPPATDPKWKDVQLFGFDNVYAFGEFNIDATLPDPEVVFKLVSEEDKVLYEIKLKRSQLTPSLAGKAK